MIEERSIKTHLIITDIHEEYEIKWTGRLIDTKPLFINDKLVFLIISGSTRVKLNTNNITQVEDCAKKITTPRGRSAVTTDNANIYLIEESGKETYMGTVIHHHVKKYSQMYDKVGYIG